MTATSEAKPWDFSHVLELVHSLSTNQEERFAHNVSNDGYDFKLENDTVKYHHNYNTHTKQNGLVESPQGLGDFTRLWQLLGTPVDSPAPVLAIRPPRGDNVPSLDLRGPIGYASDGALSTPAFGNRKQKKKEKAATSQIEDGADHPVAGAVSDGSIVPDTPTLTKAQRKKQRRKERREQEAALAEQWNTWDASMSAPESEARPAAPYRIAPPKAPVVDPVTPKQRGVPTQKHGASENAVPPKRLSTGVDAAAMAVQRVEAAKKANVQLPSNPITPNHNFAEQLHKLSQTSKPAQTSKNGHITAPNTLRLVPASVKPGSSSVSRPASASKPARNNKTNATSMIGNQQTVIRTGEERHWSLFLKLIGDFYADRKYLVSPMNLTTHNNDPKGIHVFVDASNIFIGFKDQLKRSKGLPPNVQIPALGLSFDALALLMERRRPVAKRVLVGSTPHLPAFDKAKAVGYECSILEKVYKARELTERQIYFKEQEDVRYGRKRAKAPLANNVTTANGGTSSGNGSGSETNAPQYAPAAMIEQGVDEILHLKILESIVDTDVPGTIVLATGDAAQAEYSEGFMAMAERALKKGWSVELVSWSANISAMYTKRAWTAAWGDRFRIVTLDDYAEELLDV